jgi:GTP-binding protein
VDSLDVFQGRRLFAADEGGRGQGQKKHGRNGPDLVIEVPVGTEVSAVGEKGKVRVVAQSVDTGSRLLVVSGGFGGLGNACRATPIHQAPEKSSEGRPGEEKRLVLQVKRVIDVAIIGLPNSGKSTLIGRMTRARPRIAEYPFTTREPVLGTAEVGYESVVVAELPALVPGASEGKGLGNQFLAHAERAAVLLLLLDGTATSIAEDRRALESELGKWPVDLSGKERVVAVNKADLADVQNAANRIKKQLSGFSPEFISALTGEGVPELLSGIMPLVKKARSELKPPEPGFAVFRPKPVDERGRR